MGRGQCRRDIFIALSGMVTLLMVQAGCSSNPARLIQTIESPAPPPDVDLLEPHEFASPSAPAQGGPCTNSADCDDGNACTDDRCEDAVCLFEALPLELCCQSGPLSAQDFDAITAKDLDADQPLGNSGWTLSDARAVSAPSSLYFGDSTTQSLGATQRVKGSLRLSPLTLPMEPDARLTMRLFLDIEASPERDNLTFFAEVLDEGGVIVETIPLLTKAELPDEAYMGFALVDQSLTDLAGERIRLRIAFDSVEPPTASSEGVFIDDLEIALDCPELPALDDLPGTGDGTTSPAEDALEERTPLSGDEENASSSDDEPGPQGDDLPGDGSAGDGDEELSSKEADDLTSEGDDEAPPSGDDEAPPSGDDEAPSSGDDEAPSSGDGDAPSSGDGDAPSAGGGDGPGAGTVTVEVADPCSAPDAHPNCCTSDADCDDGNPATINVCEGAECVSGWNPDGCQSDADCSDGEPCTLDICVDSVCVYEGTFGSACCEETTQPLGDFDTESLQGFYVTDNLETGIFWRTDPTRSTSGEFALYCGDPSTQTYAVGERVKSSATTPTLEVPVGGNTSLHFDLFMMTRPFHDVDVFQVFVLRDGALSAVWSSKVLPTGNTVGFMPVTVDLSSFAGQSIQLRFVFDSVDAHAPAAEGTYIDSLRLETNCL